ncbi:hypothetical protein SAY87_026217 [Trapa incisa]|uniref:AP2/ERF domain-containing protein n=1 Tax=Trapa incisa TaxID=236973 RepID=A0AAN7GTX7_9MYRT|nr:hypothetical protein SAY87_026217 [Trapa incisa]
MVSLRRRKLLGFCSGKSSFLLPLPKSSDVNSTDSSSNLGFRPISVHPLPLEDTKELDMKSIMKVGVGSSTFSGPSSLLQQKPGQSPEHPIKRRKRHQRKHRQDQECLMRGVYFKNMKWQAAIKVDKKQIHLGTVGSQVEAAHLYDRAAFMCGREPNFKLPEEEKQELKKLNWEEFLALTRHAITHKSNSMFVIHFSVKNLPHCCYVYMHPFFMVNFLRTKKIGIHGQVAHKQHRASSIGEQ